LLTYYAQRSISLLTEDQCLQLSGDTPRVILVLMKLNLPVLSLKFKNVEH